MRYHQAHPLLMVRVYINSLYNQGLMILVYLSATSTQSTLMNGATSTTQSTLMNGINSFCYLIEYYIWLLHLLHLHQKVSCLLH